MCIAWFITEIKCLVRVGPNIPKRITLTRNLRVLRLNNHCENSFYIPILEIDALNDLFAWNLKSTFH